MLEDPAYSSIVRWGNEGDTFVILEVQSSAAPWNIICADSNHTDRPLD